MKKNSLKPEIKIADEEKEILLRNIQKELPECWVVQFSKKHTNRVYYFNTLTGDRSWRHPSYSADDDTTSKSIEKRVRDKTQRKRKSDERKSPLPGKSKRQASSSHASSLQECSKRESGNSNSTLLKKKHRKLAHKNERKHMDKLKRNVNYHSRWDKTGFMEQSCIHVTGDLKGCANEEVLIIDSENSKNVAVDDVEMFDLCSSSTRHSDIGGCAGKMETEFIFILDTNIFLDQPSLTLLESLLSDASVKEEWPHGTTFLVPWVVLQELDNLKKNKASARNAVSVLNRYFREPASGIRGQSIFEAAKVIDGLKIESNDDRILQCCFFVQQSCNSKLPVLITRDKNLMNKALTNSLKCFQGLSDLRQLLHEGKMNTGLKSRKCVASQDNAQLHRTPQKVRKNESDANNNSKPRFPRNVDSHIKKDLLEKSKKYLLAAVSAILETEMKAAFDDLWLEVILCKPPWSLSDVMECMRKHWFPVFGMANVDQLVEVQLKRLIELNSRINGTVIPEDEFLEWIRGAQNLILGLRQQRKFGFTVDENLRLLKDVENELMSHRAADKDSHGLQSSETNIIEEVDNKADAQMAEEKADCSGFWIALNQIWTSIISHCGMLFQSLHFIPTHVENAPEVLQALQATFDFIPARTSAIHALPLVVELVQSVKNMLQKLLHCYDSQGTDCDANFADLLQTLWTAIQAFSIHCDLSNLMALRSEISRIISESSHMLQRLAIGFQQLCVVLGFLRECQDVVSKS